MSAITGPLDPHWIVMRLRNNARELRLVDGGGEYESLVESGVPRAVPAAFVLLGAERAGPSRGFTGGLMVQQNECLVGVVVVTRNLRAPDTGSAAAAELVPLLKNVRGAVLNWRHPDAEHPFDFHSGRVLRIAQGVIWWQEIYRTQYRIEVRP